jgi:hypothetical protein
MKMIEFLIHSSGVTPDGWFHLSQRMPSGQIIIDPKSRPVHWSQRHMHEIMQRFPQSHYRQYPQYSKPAMGSITMTSAYYAARVIPLALVLTMIHVGLRFWLGETQIERGGPATAEQRLAMYGL